MYKRQACGFELTSDADVQRFGVHQGDLVFMTNTVQMHKHLPEKRKFRAVSVVHGTYVNRIYAPCDVAPGFAMQLLHEHEDAKARKRAAKGGTASKQAADERAGCVATSTGAAPSG